jgi:hypothetical protein
MKNNWIKLSEKMPILNEIIYYKGSPHGERGRNMGCGYVMLHDDTVDQFDEWKPKILGMVTFAILHIDGVTKIEVNGVVDDGVFISEYTYKGMEYNATIPLGRISKL